MKLYFEYSNGERKLLGKPNTIKDMSREIFEFLKEHGYRSYYKRYSVHDFDELYIDFGSHTCFFVVKDMSVQDLRDLGLPEENRGEQL